MICDTIFKGAIKEYELVLPTRNISQIYPEDKITRNLCCTSFHAANSVRFYENHFCTCSVIRDTDRGNKSWIIYNKLNFYYLLLKVY